MELGDGEQGDRLDAGQVGYGEGQADYPFEPAAVVALVQQAAINYIAYYSRQREGAGPWG